MDYITPTPFWDTSYVPNPNLGINLDIDSNQLADAAINGYNFIEPSALMQFALWMMVLFVVLAGVWSILKHWQKI